jgi:hypothetical protein
VLVLILGSAVANARSGSGSDSAIRPFPGEAVTLAGTATRDSLLVERAPAISSQLTPSFYDLRTADIQVTYNGFTAQAKTVFEEAVNVWEHLIVSRQPIRVKATWKPMGTGILGGARPTYLYMERWWWYPIAISESMCWCERNAASEPDIEATFNSSFGSWYMGTGTPPSTKYDFFSVVVHEIGHGLGFTSTFQVQNGLGYYGYPLGQSPFMYFDEMERTDDPEEPLLSFNNGTVALKNHLTNGKVFFGGQKAKAAAADGKVKLYAPSTWKPGSSNSHLDETKYNGTADALMTPFLTNGEVRRAPGPITLAIFEDLGWQLATDGLAPPPENDLRGFARAINVEQYYDATGYNVGATLQNDEYFVDPQPSCAALDATVWYEFWGSSEPRDVRLTLLPDAGFDAVMAVYDVQRDGTYVEKACVNLGAAGVAESTDLAIGANVFGYVVQIGGLASANTTGEFVFSALKIVPPPEPEPPPNDDFAAAWPIAVGETWIVATADATTESGEPVPSCAPSTGKTVWFKWTANKNRTVVAKTVGSDFDTALAIYKGSTINALTQVKCNDNRAVDNASKIKFSAIGGTTYYFQVGGVAGASGDAILSLKKP